MSVLVPMTGAFFGSLIAMFVAAQVRAVIEARRIKKAILKARIVSVQKELEDSGLKVNEAMVGKPPRFIVDAFRISYSNPPDTRFELMVESLLSGLGFKSIGASETGNERRVYFRGKS